LYARRQIVVPPNSEHEEMVDLPHYLRESEGILMVDRLPERPGLDKTLAATSLSRIAKGQIRVRFINPTSETAVYRERQAIAQLNYEYEVHDQTPKFTIDELTEKQLELLKQIQLDPQKQLTPQQREKVDFALKKMIAAFAENPKAPNITWPWTLEPWVTHCATT
jgi:hypothetical protein